MAVSKTVDANKPFVDGSVDGFVDGSNAVISTIFGFVDGVYAPLEKEEIQSWY